MNNFDYTTQNINIDKSETILKSDGTIVISGIATTNDRDDDVSISKFHNKYPIPNNKITISPNALKNALPDFYKKNAPLMVDHGMSVKYRDKIVGKVLSLDYNPKEYNLDSPQPHKMQITFVATVFNDDAIKDVLYGDKQWVSLRWKTISAFILPHTEERIDTEIILVELSLTGMPKNSNAKITVVNDQDLLNTFFKKGEELIIYNTKAFVVEVYQKDKEFLYDLEFDSGWNYKSISLITETRLKEIAKKSSQNKQTNTVLSQNQFRLLW